MRKKDISEAMLPEENKKKKNKKPVKRDIRWERLDNTAHLFPAIAGENMSNVYRICVTLKEPVDPKLLQQALNMVLPKFDGFNLRMRKGVFWYYFEENGKPAPKVVEENNFPCRYIHANQNNNYLFQVTYYKYRINLEVFHVLTDGMGAINFLRELTYQYLRLRHPELGNVVNDSLAIHTSMNREDSFLKNYKHAAKSGYKKQRAYLIKGEKLQHGEFGVMHGFVNIPQLKGVCKQYGVSINEYLVAVFSWSIYQEYLKGMTSELPIRVAVPVNLRPYFDSITTKNFFAMVSAEFHPTKEAYSFEEVLQIIRDSLRCQMDKEHLEKLFSYNVSNEKTWIARIVPLPLKNIAMKHVYTASALANTTTVTNIGSISIEEPYRPYVEMFFAFLAMSKGQDIKGTICSYEETLAFSFSYTLKDVSIQRCFFRKLAADGISVEIDSNGVNYE